MLQENKSTFYMIVNGKITAKTKVEEQINKVLSKIIAIADNPEDEEIAVKVVNKVMGLIEHGESHIGLCVNYSENDTSIFPILMEEANVGNVLKNYDSDNPHKIGIQ